MGMAHPVGDGCVRLGNLRKPVLVVEPESTLTSRQRELTSGN